LHVTDKWPAELLIQHAGTDKDNVVSVDFMAGRAPEPLPRTGSRGRRALAVAASILVLLTAGLVSWLCTDRDLYTTTTGEQRSIILGDGSTVELNARTQLRIHYSAHERHVNLLKGQALFTVARDKERPFIVASNGTQVRAVGTRFDVYKKSSGTVVTVLEGTVAVTPAPELFVSTAAAALVTAGEQLTVGPISPGTKVHPVSLAATTAWTQRQLVFDNTALQEVVNEFNRYNQRQLVIRDPLLNDFAIDGVFSSTDPASLIRFLRSRPGVVVTETESEIIIASH
jgi:transmembrane sensor